MPDRASALVVGASGVVGRNLVNFLAGRPGWRVTGLSRRRPEVPAPVDWVEVDLLDEADCRARLVGLDHVTHLFYAGYVERPSRAELVAPNLAMLRNAVEAVVAQAPGLAHVNLIEGTKWYGSHLGPFKTPAKESDPRHVPPNFYFDQQDYLDARQNGQGWTWSALRPHAVCGFSLGFPMNLTMVIAIYAAIMKELGRKFSFPGRPAAYGALYQVTDAPLLAKAMLWAATTPACANQAFNITNGDYFRWINLWPGFARAFGMDLGEPEPIILTDFMADKEPVWQRIVARHGLKPYRLRDLVQWPFGDFVFATEWDVMSDTVKARRYGFCDAVDSEQMFLRLFDEFRAAAVLPRG